MDAGCKRLIGQAQFIVLNTLAVHQVLVPGCSNLHIMCCRWLSPGGVILPDIASLHVMAVDDRQYLAEQSKLWSGGQLGPGEPELKPVLNGVIRHPRLDSISRRAQLVTDRQQLLELDLYKATLQVSASRYQPGKLATC
jgi:hypothetical protein